MVKATCLKLWFDTHKNLLGSILLGHIFGEICLILVAILQELIESTLAIHDYAAEQPANQHLLFHLACALRLRFPIAPTGL